MCYLCCRTFTKVIQQSEKKGCRTISQCHPELTSVGYFSSHMRKRKIKTHLTCWNSLNLYVCYFCKTSAETYRLTSWYSEWLWYRINRWHKHTCECNNSESACTRLSILSSMSHISFMHCRCAHDNLILQDPKLDVEPPTNLNPKFDATVYVHSLSLCPFVTAFICVRLFVYFR